VIVIELVFFIWIKIYIIYNILIKLVDSFQLCDNTDIMREIGINSGKNIKNRSTNRVKNTEKYKTGGNRIVVGSIIMD